VKKVKEKNRKLAYISAPAASEMSVHQALETSQKERQKLEGDKQRLVKLNQNQKKAIRSLETSIKPDKNPEMQKQAQREDNLEQGAALLANLYFF
jgi:hypothetical protein